MPAISARKRVCPNQGVMKPRSQLIRWKRVVFNSIPWIAKQLIQFDCNQGPVASDIFVRSSKLASPPSDFIEHLAMQVAAKAFKQHLWNLGTPKLSRDQKNVFLLPIVQCAVGFDMPWN